MGARTEAKALESIKSIKERVPAADIHFLQLDLASFRSVKAAAHNFAARETVLHGLINNAGIMGVPFATTEDGFEVHIQTNYISHWLLTHLLLPVLVETAINAKPGEVRIVNLTSGGHATFTVKEGIRFSDVNLRSERGMTRYGQSKLANILHAKALHARYGSGENGKGRIVVSAVHPGNIDTDLTRQATDFASTGTLTVMSRVMKCVGILDKREKGAYSSLYAVASPDFTESGAYVVPYAKIGTPSSKAMDPELAEELWEWTEKELKTRGVL
ncbi:hypothetical protein F5Y19DRAFT_428618 [Xylariaceae sp. FL1651]|nr:hypothetical protein F5Y19DRAFT_428618 [Xylariaceae sp. FL1651]